MKMSGRVTIRRIVATTNMSALQTQPQMNPAGADFETFFATLTTGRNGMDMHKVIARHYKAPDTIACADSRRFAAGSQLSPLRWQQLCLPVASISGDTGRTDCGITRGQRA
jgi:hypothetical protein